MTKYHFKRIILVGGENNNTKVQFTHRRNEYFYVTIDYHDGYEGTETYTPERANNLFKTLINAGYKKTYETAF